MRITVYPAWIKRSLDFFFSGLFLLLLAPLCLVLAALVYLTLGSPVFFRQERPGRGEKLFTLVKFRTMQDLVGESGQVLPDADRLASFGRFLRSSSLDELPELWCIFKGDMSFVGPRPLSRHYLPFYTQEESRRHQVRPGLTGLAQVSGRNALDWDRRLALDLAYVDHVSFKQDLLIILRTVGKVFRREDVVVAGTGDVGDLDVVRQVQRPGYGMDGEPGE